MKTILVVDASVGLCDFVKYTLFQEGVSIIGATSEEGALLVLKDQPVDLILLDTAICLEGGIYEVLMLDSKTKTIPIIFMTTPQDLSQEEGLLLLNGQDYVLKPLQKFDLIFRVKRYLQVPLVTVLTVTPSLELQEQLLQTLIPQGFQIITASKKETVLPLLTLHNPQLVMIDAAFSENLLQEVIKTSKQHESGGKIVLLMGVEDMVTAKGELLPQVDDYVMKPLVAKDLILRAKRLGSQMKPLQSSKAVVGDGAIQEAKEKLLQQIQVSLHHEIRSPLTSILIGSQALHKKFEEGSPERQVVNGIENCSRRIKDIMDSLGNMKELVEEEYAYGVKMISFSKSTTSEQKPAFVQNPFLAKQA